MKLSYVSLMKLAINYLILVTVVFFIVISVGCESNNEVAEPIEARDTLAYIASIDLGDTTLEYYAKSSWLSIKHRMIVTADTHSDMWHTRFGDAVWFTDQQRGWTFRFRTHFKPHKSYDSYPDCFERQELFDIFGKTGSFKFCELREPNSPQFRECADLADSTVAVTMIINSYNGDPNIKEIRYDTGVDSLDRERSYFKVNKITYVLDFEEYIPLRYYTHVMEGEFKIVGLLTNDGELIDITGTFTAPFWTLKYCNAF